MEGARAPAGRLLPGRDPVRPGVAGRLPAAARGRQAGAQAARAARPDALPVPRRPPAGGGRVRGRPVAAGPGGARQLRARGAAQRRRGGLCGEGPDAAPAPLPEPEPERLLLGRRLPVGGRGRAADRGARPAPAAARRRSGTRGALTVCGICGTYHYREGNADAALVDRQQRVLAHRGPDDWDVWSEGPVALGHRRLSIVDLSPGGHQPMPNEDESLWVTYNGELYGWPELKAVLAARGHRFRGASDTEALLHLYEEHGDGLLEHLRGMFAFAP